MVTVVFYNLLRSKYQIEEMNVSPGSVYDIMNEIMQKEPNIKEKDFNGVVVFIGNKIIRHKQFDTFINDNERIIMTHFVGGG